MSKFFNWLFGLFIFLLILGIVLEGADGLNWLIWLINRTGWQGILGG